MTDRFNLRAVSLDTQARIEQALAAIGVDPRGRAIMAPKGLFFLLHAQGLTNCAAVILKQEMLAKGGEAATPRAACTGGDGQADVLLMGTFAQLGAVCRTLAEEPFGLKALGEELQVLLGRLAGPPRPMTIGGREFVWGQRTYVMGILNATPDSFSGDGLWQAPDPVTAAVTQAREMVEAGADILDIGAESTRPGAEPIGAEEEMGRLLPILRAVAESVKVPVSADTSKGAVAEAALANGASCVNDIRGLRHDPAMAGVVARAGVPLIVMHSQDGTGYRDLMGDILCSLRQSLAEAEAAGIPIDRTIVDPGIGGGSFGKSREQNLAVLRNLRELRSLGRPILFGPSRKSVIRQTLDLPVTELVFGTAAMVALGIAAGADIVRVHDVREMTQVARMADAICRGDTV